MYVYVYTYTCIIHDTSHHYNDRYCTIISMVPARHKS